MILTSSSHLGYLKHCMWPKNWCIRVSALDKPSNHPPQRPLTTDWSHALSESLIRLTFQPVTLAQLVKASVSQTDVQRFEPHLGHNLLSCGVFLVKSRHFGLPLAQP